MKHIYLFIIIPLFLTCQSNKTLVTQPIINLINSTICPEDGVCTFEVFNNKTLHVQTDGIGALYPELLDGKKTVIKFEYKRHEIPNTADGGYSEIIYAEIDSNIKEATFKNETLSTAKVLFGRLCFCRGETGYFYVNEGELKITTSSDGMKTYKLDFKVHEVPQIITSIEETL